MYKLTGIIISFFIIICAVPGQNVSATPCVELAEDSISLPICNISEPQPSEYALADIIVPPAKDMKITEVIKSSPVPRYVPTEMERRLLACLVWREDHTSVESMMAVAEVVFNRMDSDHHSFCHLETVEQTIFQASWINGCYVEQYACADTLLEENPPPEAYEAVDRVCAGERLLGEDALFHTEKSVPSWKVANNIYVVDEIGSSKFWGLDEG